MTLSAEEKTAIIELDIFRNIKKGTVLLREGECSGDGYFVIKGCLRSYYLVNGEEKTTAFHTETDMVAPLCSVTKQPSEYYIDCLEDSIITVGNADMEKAIFERFPRFESLCRVISEELLAKNQATFDDFKTSSPEQRYLNLLKTRPDLLQRVPQYQIASYLGMKPQSLSRIRKRIVEEQEKNTAPPKYS